MQSNFLVKTCKHKFGFFEKDQQRMVLDWKETVTAAKLFLRECFINGASFCVQRFEAIGPLSQKILMRMPIPAPITYSGQTQILEFLKQNGLKIRFKKS